MPPEGMLVSLQERRGDGLIFGPSPSLWGSGAWANLSFHSTPDVNSEGKNPALIISLPPPRTPQPHPHPPLPWLWTQMNTN